MKGRYFSMALMGRKIAAIRAYVVEGGGADYHDQSAEHWIVKQIATPMSIYPEYKATRTSFGINALKTLVVEVEADNGVTVVLDTNLSEELLEEGFVREVVSKIQSMRKEAGFEVTDHITFSYKGSDKAADIIGRNEAAIASDVLADEVKASEVVGYEKEWNINGEKVTLGVEKR